MYSIFLKVLILKIIAIFKLINLTYLTLLHLSSTSLT